MLSLTGLNTWAWMAMLVLLSDTVTINYQGPSKDIKNGQNLEYADLKDVATSWWKEISQQNSSM